MTGVQALVAGVSAAFGGVGVIAGYLWGRREGYRDGVESGWRLGLDRGRQDACAQMPFCALREGPVSVNVEMMTPAAHPQSRTLSASRDELLQASDDLKSAAKMAHSKGDK